MAVELHELQKFVSVMIMIFINPQSILSFTERRAADCLY